MPSRILKYCGFLAIAVLWSTVLASIFVTKFNLFGTLPVSYLGVYEQSKYLFNGGLIVSSILLLGFLYYFSEHQPLSKWFIAIFVAGQICQIIVALTPYNSQSYIRSVHVVSAFALAFTLPLSMYALRYSRSVSAAVLKVTSRFLQLELVLFVLGIGWFISASAAGALSEIITAIGYDVWVIALSMKLLKLPKTETANS